jgi:hypothetical protein
MMIAPGGGVVAQSMFPFPDADNILGIWAIPSRMMNHHKTPGKCVTNQKIIIPSSA